MTSGEASGSGLMFIFSSSESSSEMVSTVDGSGGVLLVLSFSSCMTVDVASDLRTKIS